MSNTNKLAILNDTHIGCRNSNERLAEHIKEFFEKTFFPYCDKNKIFHILHLGDWFDCRTHTTVKAKILSNWIISEMRRRGMKMYIIPGNHDVMYKNTNTPSAMIHALEKESDVVTIYEQPTILSNGVFGNILVVPWVNSSNLERTLSLIDSAPASIVAGHFDIAGFRMMINGQESCDGFSPSIFSRFDQVWSGHFHTRSTKGNIHYFGSQTEFTWADCEDEKYFHVWHVEKQELEPVPTNSRLFFKIRYDEEFDKDPTTLGIPKNSIIKIIPLVASNKLTFEKYIEQVEKKLEPYDLGVVMPLTETGEVSTEDSDELVIDTPTLIERYINESSNETATNKSQLVSMALEIYQEASVRISDE